MDEFISAIEGYAGTNRKIDVALEGKGVNVGFSFCVADAGIESGNNFVVHGAEGEIIRIKNLPSLVLKKAEDEEYKLIDWLEKMEYIFSI